MDDFFVLIISKNLFTFSNISNYFEEEEAITLVDTLNNVTSDIIALNAIAADLVIFMDVGVSGVLFERVCEKVDTPYYESYEVEDVKEFIAEKFLEWGEERGT
jgi:hypothetical protein